MKINLEKDIKNFISEKNLSAAEYTAKAAEKYGAAAYLIGGAVRDVILKIPVKDIDITIETDAPDFCRRLEKENKCRIISVQENLRTVKAEFPSGAEIDIASAREEYYLKGGSLPSAYNFGCSLENDVKRRDFTINTLAVSLSGCRKYTLIDYCRGYDDIKNKKIRVLHNKSFIDDPSRIIRALKFQMRLGFEIEENTLKLMQEYLENPDKNMPLERIKSELIQYFSIKKDGLYENLIDKKAYKLICSSPCVYACRNALEDIKNYIEAKDLPFIYIMLLFVNSDIENQKQNLTAEEKDIIKNACLLLKSAPLNINDNYAVFSAFSGKSKYLPIIYYIISHDKAVLKYLEELQHIKVLITGRDLIKAGFHPSPAFGRVLDALLKEKLLGRLKIKEEELEYAVKYLSRIQRMN